MKGCFIPSPYPRATIPKLFQRIVELSADPKYDVTILQEYFSLKKANEVADDATAYRRGLSPNVLCLVMGKGEPEEVFEYSRDAAHELIGLVAGTDGNNLGYGNYSASVLRPL